MQPPPATPRRGALLGLAAIFLLSLLPARAAAQADRDKQVAELEKQLAELQKKLAELKGTAAAPADRKPLELADALKWRGIRGVALSRDGQWFACRVGPSEGEGEVIVRQTKGDKEHKLPGGEGGFGVSFSDDSKWLAFNISPRPSRPRGPVAAVLPFLPRASSPGKVVLVELATGNKTEFDGVRRFAFSGKASGWIALHRAPESPAPSAPTAPSTPTTGTTETARPARPGGTDLILRNLASGDELTLGNVSDFAFNKKGDLLALVIDAAGQVGNGVQLRNMATGVLSQLDSAKASYQGLAWAEEGDGLVVLKGTEDKAYKDKLYSVVGFTGLSAATPQKAIFDPHKASDFPKGMTVSPNRPAYFSDDLSTIFFGIHEVKKADAKPEAKDEDKSDVRTPPGPTGRVRPTEREREKPDLVIWHWLDDRLQPMQQVQAGTDKSQSHLCAYRLKDKNFVRLGDDTLRQVIIAPKQRWAIGLDGRPYQRQSTLDGKRFQDVYAVDLQTGQRRQVLARCRYYFGPSPDGARVLHYQDGHFFVCDLATGKSTRITPESGVSFVDAEDDHPIDRPPTRSLGWLKDSSAVLLSDNWDVWKVPVDGSSPVNLTADGKRDSIRYRRRLTLDPDEKGIDLSKPQYFSVYGEWTKKAGFARLDPGQAAPTRLCFDDAEYGVLMKAREAEVFVYTRETFKDYPEYHAGDAGFKNGKKLTTTNPQQDKVRWTSGVRLVDYTSTKGDRLQAALLLPANYESGKSYPTVVYIYERLSQRLNAYNPPSASGFNPTVYTSNGYAVLMPDIRYHINDPGRSAVWCVLPALDAAVATGVVDKARVGLHGHSWGGYQTSFLITQTEAFKAAVAGAPLTNLVSMYSSVYWNTGSANQPIFESSQGRFTAGYWEDLDAYLRNSPVIHAKKVKTPLLLLHNDKDGAVDFTQGIEYFNTLRRLEKPVVMLQYKGENHGLAKPANQRDYARRMREFFDHHLMGKPAPAWLKEGVPHLKMDEHLEERSKGS